MSTQSPVEVPLSATFLQTVPVFGGFTDEEYALLARYLRRASYAPGAVLVHEGDLAKEMYIVLEGRVQVVKGDDTTVSELGPGQSFGEMALIDIQPRSATVRTVVPSEVAALGFDDVVRIYNRNLPMYTLMVLNIAREISRRLREANQRIVALGHDAIPHP